MSVWTSFSIFEGFLIHEYFLIREIHKYFGPQIFLLYGKVRPSMYELQISSNNFAKKFILSPFLFNAVVMVYFT